MKVRNQIVEGGEVILDTTLEARTAWVALHDLLKFSKVQYDPARFFRFGDWVCWRDQGRIYRTMSSRRFG